MKSLHLLPAMLMTLCAACATDPQAPDVPDRPGGSGVSPQPDDALYNPAPRAVTPLYTLSYADGGIIMGRTAAGTLYAVDISDGRRVDYNPAAATLSIDSRPLTVTAHSLARELDGTRWYRISTTDGEVLIVTRL